MTELMVELPFQTPIAGFRRFTVPEYHRLIEIGILNEDDDLELLEGYLVHKMSRNPPHDAALVELMQQLVAVMGSMWVCRPQCAISLNDSEPEPDLAIVRKRVDKYRSHHPGPADIGLVIEVSDATLATDRIDKGRIYARAELPIYWILNIPERIVEVYTRPTGPTDEPRYTQRTDFRSGDHLPVILDGVNLAELPVVDLFG